MFKPPEALPIHTLSKLHYLIHDLYLTNHLSFPKLLNCGTHCHPLLSLNPKICHLLNLTSTNLILSPFLLKLPLIFSLFPLSVLRYRPCGLSMVLLTKKKEDIYCFTENENLFPEEQKGCRRKSRGRKDQLLSDEAVLKECRRRRTNLAVAWIDCRKHTILYHIAGF